MNRGETMINVSIFLISLLIFLNTFGYAVYEFQNQNKLGGTIVIILSIFMIIFVNVSMYYFK